MLGSVSEEEVVTFLPFVPSVAEIVTGYGYPESAIFLIVIAECALVVLYLVRKPPSLPQS